MVVRIRVAKKKFGEVEESILGFDVNVAFIFINLVETYLTLGDIGQRVYL